MPAVVTWYEQNGAPVGTPAGGKISIVKNCDWKSEDSAVVARADAPVPAGENSFNKYNYVGFTGDFNQLKEVKWAHTSGELGAGLGLLGKVTSVYEKPSQELMHDAIDMTSPIDIADGQDVKLSTVAPNSKSTRAQMGQACYTQYLETQVTTMVTAQPGDSGEVTLTLQYKEN